MLDTVRDIIAEVLMVPRESVGVDSALVGDLGAESIDFLDLVFRIEDALGKKIPTSRWDAFVAQRLAGTELSRSITTAVVVEFAETERDRPRA